MTNVKFFEIGRVAYVTGNVQEALVAKQALIKVVEDANNLQRLKAEIIDLANKLSDLYHTPGGTCGDIDSIIAKLMATINRF